jgi:nitronate monooxygenase
VSYGPRYEVQVEALIEAAPPVFSFVFGVPSSAVLGACRARGIVTIGAATSVAEAQALEAAGVDLIVASGSEAGGHRPSFLARAEDVLCGSFVLTQRLSRAVRTPIITAGGIADRRGVLAAHALGARGVQVGTAFLACEESGAPALHRERLLGAQSRETVLTRAFSGRLARGLRNRWTDLHADGRRPIAPYPVQGWFLAQLRAAALAAGRTDVISLWSGQIAPVLTRRAAAAVFDSLIGAES